MKKLTNFVKKEANILHPRLLVAQLLLAPLPPFFGGTIRAAVLRLFGFTIGPKTTFWGTPRLVGGGKIYRHLRIGSSCMLGLDNYFDLTGPVTIGNQTTTGPQVMFLTGTHEIGDSRNRLGKLIIKPVVVGSGVWFGARCTVLPGVTIGDGAVIAAGSIVTHDIPPDVLAAGVPAVVKRSLCAENVNITEVTP